MRTTRRVLYISTLLLFFGMSLRAMPSVYVCAEEEVNLDAFLLENSKGTAFSWRNSNTDIGLKPVGAGKIPHFTACNSTAENSVAVIYYTTILPNGHAQILEFMLVVRPKPSIVLDTLSLAVCNNSFLNQAIVSRPKGARFSIEKDNPDIGLTTQTHSDGLNLSVWSAREIPQNTYLYITPILNTCVGTPKKLFLAVIPTPSVMPPQNLVVCSNTPVNTIFSSNFIETNFEWTNDNPSIGLPSAGTDHLNFSTASNQTGENQVATIVVTPRLNGCVGPSKSFTITVKPDPVLEKTAYAFCVNDSGHIDFKTNLKADSSTVFSWISNNINTGLPPEGMANTVAFKAASNNLGETITAHLMVKATTDGCSATTLATVKVKPRPVLYNPGNVIIETGQQVALNFTTNIEGTHVDWTSSSTVDLLPSSGSDTIKFIAPPNTAKAPIIMQITATPSLDGCAEQAQEFLIILPPTPSVLTPFATAPYKITTRQKRQD